ncbi:DUF1853 family protein [Chitinimonas arctica]|uniref:DUF1853 family protein n=1 Tax=Chitinimonas arctica TaxID=2594795 RepID=A0A516SG55_9NEIS|nr:DUF1853 family protein [Chitinimonas arctica]QDQ27146.1 DUF1853 family protein [Chitinimonas arctica]
MTAPPDTQADLHWLLTSPSLLAPAALPPGVLDGDAAVGQDWWRQLSADLPAALASNHPFRLGRHAEALMRTAFERLPGHRLIASQLPVRDHGISLGEYDFLLAQAAGMPALHIELAVKFYIALPVGERMVYVGPGLRDGLDLKLARLFDHQLKLSNSPAGRAALPVGLVVQPMSWLRGRMLYRDDLHPPWEGLAPDHLRGWWRCFGEAVPQTRADSRWRSLPKPHWLAAAQGGEHALPLAAWLDQAARHFAESNWPLMVAEYAPPEAGGQELARGMLLHADWPDQAMLKTLMARIDALALDRLAEPQTMLGP